MNAATRSGFFLYSVFATMAATAQSAPELAGARFLAPIRSMTLTQVEYCMRNAAELRTELALAHATYSLALDRAVQILDERFPEGRRVAASRLNTDTKRSEESALKSAESAGPGVCPLLLTHMHNATGESLAAHFGDAYSRILQAELRH
jgi:hypothetical protein